jgi:hypothetical protein
MNPYQVTADCAEDSMIGRYQERRSSIQHLTVCCGRCRSIQFVSPYAGLERFVLICSRCHAKTLITTPGSAFGCSR